MVEKIRDLPNAVTAVALDGAWACVAMASHYAVLNVETGRSQDLFPVEEGVAPVVARVAKVRTRKKKSGAFAPFSSLRFNLRE